MAESLSSSLISRRNFLSTSARLGTVIAAAPYISRAQAVGAKGDTLNVALIGCGVEGKILTTAMLPIQMSGNRQVKVMNSRMA